MDLQNLHKELKFKMSRSGGSGGQHVNKVSTKVELIFSIKDSIFLSKEEKKRLYNQLASRINKEGYLVMESQKSRSQLLNKKDVIRKFEKLIATSITPPKQRKFVAIKADKNKRLKAKKFQSDKKANRKKVIPNVENGLSSLY